MGMKRMIVGILGVAAVVMVVLMAALWVLQDRMLYHPRTRGPAAARGLASEAGLTVISDRDGRILGYRSRRTADGTAAAAGTDTATATVIIFHGNAGDALDRVHYVRALGQRGYEVILAEHPGYGPRSGEHSQASLVRAGTDLVRRIGEEGQQRLILWGESLGAAVVTGIARDTAPGDPDLLAGLVLMTPWNNLPDLAAEHLGRQLPFLPIRWLCRDAYDSGDHLTGWPKPVLFVVAEEDEVIPPHHAQALIEEYQGPQAVITLRGVGHNDWPRHPSADWWNRADHIIRREMLAQRRAE
jgi:alpha-beta hydrolase superfamily lysophospholipase